MSLNDRSEVILGALRRHAPQPLSLQELAHHLGADAPSPTTLRRDLKKMAREGVIERVDRHLWALGSVAPKGGGAADATLPAGPQGRLVLVDGRHVVEREGGTETLVLHPRHVGEAMAGDQVRVERVQEGRGKLWAVREYSSSVPRIVRGRIERQGRALLLISDMVGEPLLVERDHGDHMAEGDEITVKVVGRSERALKLGGVPAYPMLVEPLHADMEDRRELPKAQAAFAQVVQGETNATRLLDQLSRSLRVDAPFSEEAQRQADSFSEPEGPDPEGMDLTDVALVTIDGPTAKDFDDAVFAEYIGDEIRLLVTVADVGRYVEQDSILDMEARERGSSVYLPGRVYPMLPKVLSDGLCSLVPHKLRHCAWVSMILTPTGDIVDADAGFGTMRSRARLTYGEVQEFLDGEREVEDEEVAASLHCLEETRRRLHAKRRARGMLDLDMAEQEIRLSEDGASVQTVEPAPRLAAHRLIEEAMLATNETVANLLSAEGWPHIRRGHADPNPERVLRVARIAEGLGLKFSGRQVPSIDELNAAIERVQGTPQSRAFSFLLLRSLSPASYTVEDIGHFGIGAPRYLHFTSPIRRYPDLEVHRLLRRMLEEKAPKGRERQELTERLVHSAEHSNRGEKLATRAERYSNRLLSALYMMDHVGEVFDAVVMDVVHFGLFIGLGRPNVEGLIPMRQLGSDYWEFDEEEVRMVGQRSGITWRIGQRVRVRCESVNLAEGQISFVPLDTPAERSPPLRRGERGGAREERGSGGGRGERRGAKSSAGGAKGGSGGKSSAGGGAKGGSGGKSSAGGGAKGGSGGKSSAGGGAKSSSGGKSSAGGGAKGGSRSARGKAESDAGSGGAKSGSGGAKRGSGGAKRGPAKEKESAGGAKRRPRTTRRKS